MQSRQHPTRARRWSVGRLTVVPVTVAAVAIGLASPAHAAADTQPPTAPGPITIAEITETWVRLTWAAATDDVGVVGYEVTQFYTDVGILHTTPTNSITITGLQPSRTYHFGVRARDAAGNVSFGPGTLTVTMPPGDDQPPTAPGRPIASNVLDTSLTLSWPGSSDNIYVAQYEVLSITSAGNVVVGRAPQHPPTGTTTRVSGLSPGTTYTLAVRARDDAGNYSALSPTITVTTRGTTGPDVTPPTVPGTPAASEVTPYGANLTWTPSTDDFSVAQYVVLDMTVPGGRAEIASTPYTSVSLGLSPGRTYVLAVAAQDAAGNRSAPSGTVVFTTPPEPAPPCVVEYLVRSQWPGGFQAEVVVRNTGPAPVEGWTVAWAFPDGQRITGLYGAVRVPGAEGVTVRNQSWNARIAPGRSVTFGFIGAWSGANAEPAAFTLNGVACGVR